MQEPVGDLANHLISLGVWEQGVRPPWALRPSPGVKNNNPPTGKNGFASSAQTPGWNSHCKTEQLKGN